MAERNCFSQTNLRETKSYVYRNYLSSLLWVYSLNILHCTMAMLNVLFYIASMTQRRRKTYSLLCYELVSSLFSFINVECSPGNYGINCLQKCGECRGKSPCNKINGSCPDGCSAGYIGSLCSEREYFYDIFSDFFGWQREVSLLCFS